MKKPIFPLTAMFYKKQDYKVRIALQQLYPLENTEKLLNHFQMKKMTVTLGILVFGVVSALCLHLCSRKEGRMAEGAQLVRNEWGAGDYQITLRAKVENWSREIPFLVKARGLTEEEQDALEKKLYAELPDLIKNKNSDLLHIDSDLNLVSSVPGYPFQLIWSSSNHERINKNGKVNRKGMEEKESIDLTVMLSYGQEKSNYTYQVSLLPEMPGKEESFFQSLEERLSMIDLEEKDSKQISLPDSFQGKKIEWEEIRKNYAIGILLLTLFCCAIVGRGMESDLEKSCKQRNRQLAADYPKFVSKLRLYLAAGLTVKNAFYRIMEDYGSRQEHKKRKYLYEEMQISCHQMENGVPEELVYGEFGKRCRETRYRRLSFLLAIHLKQGNQQLLTLLSEEADSAQEDRRAIARKAGEEAGTKLLLPMMLMLMVVMFLVLLPAYLNFEKM